jgi:hypothetical protein
MKLLRAPVTTSHKPTISIRLSGLQLQLILSAVSGSPWDIRELFFLPEQEQRDQTREPGKYLRLG